MDEMLATAKVSVVLANWNGAEFTIPCIESLLMSDYPDFRIIVVDDASTDASPVQIAQRFPEADLIGQPANRGVSAARNRGIARALELASDYVLFLDNDTKVDRSLISHLVATAEARNDAAAVGPKIYYLHDRSRLWFAFGQLSLWTGIYRNPVFGAMDRGQFDREREMEVASSCCLLVPARVLQVVGGFDPDYTWNEDVDWSLRCRRAGFPLVFCPKGKVWHKVGGSSQKQSAASIRYLLTRNQLWTFRRVARPCQMISISIVYAFRAILRIIAVMARRKWGCIPAELRGAKEGFFAPIK
jgi:GT2 family glycosyltransferase